jgi:hypothetical protein
VEYNVDISEKVSAAMVEQMIINIRYIELD